MSYLDLQSWNRKAHFHFFKDYTQPFFNICAEVDVTGPRTVAKERGFSFFLVSLFCSNKAANAVPSFRFRLRGDRVWVYDQINMGSTVLNSDKTFGFCYFDYDPEFNKFYSAASESLAAYKRREPSLNPEDHRDDLIHYSVIPWVSFTSFQHARTEIRGDSVPKITFGKYREQNGRTMMPVSVEVHHALMDGFHVSRYFENLEASFAAVADLF